MRSYHWSIEECSEAKVNQLDRPIGCPGPQADVLGLHIAVHQSQLMHVMQCL
jgi:hypothetical protein